jgi:Transposase DDE domain
MNLEDISNSIEFLQINHLLEELFDEETLQKQSLDTHFVIRKTSQLTGRMFLLLNTIELVNYPKNSLQDQCLWLNEHFGVEFKKQSLDERYNTHSVSFLKRCFENLLSQWFIKEKPQGLTTTFNRILLRDSSTWQLPPSLSTFYPSKNSSKTGASIKIDYCVNYLDGKMEQLVLESGRVPDSKINTEYMPSYQTNDLIVNDLAYWNYKAFKSYDKIGAYFVSRLKTDASLFDLKTNESIVLADVLPKGDSMISFDCSLAHPQTHKGGIPVRVCIEKVPQSVREQRLEKLQKKAKSQNWNLSELRIELCGYNLYVTNASQKQLPSSLIRLVYGIRWQIELIFKIWKSIFEIDQVKPMSIFRFECMLYGRLILILISNQLQALFKSKIESIDDFELSEIKAASSLKKN